MYQPTDEEMINFLNDLRMFSIEPVDSREEPGDIGPRTLRIFARNMAEKHVRISGTDIRKLLTKAMQQRGVA